MDNTHAHLHVNGPRFTSGSEDLCLEIRNESEKNHSIPPFDKSSHHQ